MTYLIKSFTISGQMVALNVEYLIEQTKIECDVMVFSPSSLDDIINSVKNRGVSELQAIENAAIVADLSDSITGILNESNPI